jgi:hypothetical protein
MMLLLTVWRSISREYIQGEYQKARGKISTSVQKERAVRWGSGQSAGEHASCQVGQQLSVGR